MVHGIYHLFIATAQQRARRKINGSAYGLSLPEAALDGVGCSGEGSLVQSRDAQTDLFDRERQRGTGTGAVCTGDRGSCLGRGRWLPVVARSREERRDGVEREFAAHPDRLSF